MTTEDAIKKAIGGGFWDYFDLSPLQRVECRPDGKTQTVIVTGDGLVLERQLEELLLDPSFWQSLGKAMGWDKWGTRENPEIIDYDVTFRSYLKKPLPEESSRTATEALIKHESNKNITAIKLKTILHGEIMTPWRFHWHRFIDHIANGEDAASYFTNLPQN